MSVLAAERALSMRLLHRQPVLGRDGMAGELVDMLFDDERWLVRYLVIDNFGAMPRRDVLVQPAEVAPIDGTLRIELGRDELKHRPSLDEDRPVYLQYDMGGMPRPADPHLRSAEIILGFALRTNGTPAGRLKDIEIDAERWAIASLVVDSGVWLPGKRRVVDPRQVRSIDWIARTIELR
jgi:hypothetical protein